MFKDLMKSIFSEEIDIDEAVEAHEEAKKVKKAEAKKRKEEKKEEKIKFEETKAVSPIIKQEKKKEMYERVEQPILSKPVIEEKKSEFMTLDVDQVTSQKKKKNKTTSYTNRAKPTPVIKPQVNKNYDYQTVVSPIFGSAIKYSKNNKQTSEPVKLEKKAETKSFDQVISPIYGSNYPKKKKKQAYIPKKEVKEQEYNEPEIISLSDILEKKKKDDSSLKQEKLFVSKN